MNTFLFDLYGTFLAVSTYLILFLERVLCHFLPTIPINIFSPASQAQSALHALFSSTAVTMLPRLGFSWKGLLGVRYSSNVAVSSASFSCLNAEQSLCYSLVVYDALVSSCMA